MSLSPTERRAALYDRAVPSHLLEHGRSDVAVSVITEAGRVLIRTVTHGISGHSCGRATMTMESARVAAEMAERFAETCGLGQDAARCFVTLVAFNHASDNVALPSAWQLRRRFGFSRFDPQRWASRSRPR